MSDIRAVHVAVAAVVKLRGPKLKYGAGLQSSGKRPDRDEQVGAGG